MAGFRFSRALLAWFDRAGRQDLPWQQDISPYRVWVSEIMLQQTQANTVIPYFLRFTQSFPDLSSLAYAPRDKVLAHWTGLGYYARARHLHQTAQEVCSRYGGALPDTLHELMALPGIGRSTAGAILSIGFGKRAPILDGNVKRVLARFHAVSGWPGDKQVQDVLWNLAEQHTPTQRVGAYTQAIMDLGALVCTRRKPACHQCPLKRHCQAYQQAAVLDFPGSKPRKMLPTQSTQMLVIRNSRGEVLLQQRPSEGLWGGLWCFPEISVTDDITSACKTLCNDRPSSIQSLPPWRHTFSHYHLNIQPMLLTVRNKATTPSGHQWVTPAEAKQGLGLSAPTCRLLNEVGTC